MTYYIHVYDDLVEKHCREGRICFWVGVALLNPSGTSDLYVFDCSISRFLRKEYADKLDSRLLLSFKSPIGINSIQYGNKMNYQTLNNVYPCTIEDIQSYIIEILGDLDAQLSRTREHLSKLNKTRWMSRSMFPSRGDYHVLRGTYYGILVKSRIIRDLVIRLGFKENKLYANLTKANVLLSLNLRKRVLTGLILDKHIKLDVHSKLIDIDSILSFFNYIY